ncbi:hypothetical protein HanIR_Chr06g0268351 [Helianthus annuus]|nr:hypothetical protein HanIR_Chr06g0268351 [Helianthus annuus]
MRFAGGLSFLVTFNEDKKMKETMEEIKQVWSGELEELYVWEGQVIPYKRLAWLAIRGVPIQLWSKEVMNEIAGKFERVVCESTADTRDLNLSLDSVGIIVCNGKKIKENLEIIWKGVSFDVWVSEMDVTWYPSYIKLANVRQVSTDTANHPPNFGSPVDHARTPPEKNSSPRSSETPANIPARAVDTNEELEGGGEKPVNTGSEESGGEATLDVEPLVGNHNYIGTPVADNIYDGGNLGGNDNDSFMQPESVVGHQVNQIDENVGPAQEENNKDNKTTQKKRKRSLNLEVKDNALKPIPVVRKNGGIDLNVELSDETRWNPRKKSTKTKFRLRKNKVRSRQIRVSEDLGEEKGYSLDDEFESEWEDEGEPVTISESDLEPKNKSEGTDPGSGGVETEEECRNTEHIGIALGCDLSKNKKQIEDTINGERVDAMSK